MTKDRRTTTVPRSWVISVVVGMFVLAGVLVMVGLAILRQGEDVAELVQRQRIADRRAEESAKESTDAARKRLSDALVGVQEILDRHINAHDDSARNDHNLQMQRLAELLGRTPPPSIPRPRPEPAPRPRPTAPPSPSPTAPTSTSSPHRHPPLTIPRHHPRPRPTAAPPTAAPPSTAPPTSAPKVPRELPRTSTSEPTTTHKACRVENNSRHCR